jgi:hypothetical protein
MSPRARVTADVALLVLLLAVTALTVLTSPSQVRTAVAITAVCLVPGGAVLTLLPVGGFGQWLGMAMALSMAIVALGAFTMLWASWQPVVLGGALAVCSVALLSFDAVKRATKARPNAGRHRIDVADLPVAGVNGRGYRRGLPPSRRFSPDPAARRGTRAVAWHGDGAGGALAVFSAAQLSFDAVKSAKEAETW